MTPPPSPKTKNAKAPRGPTLDLPLPSRLSPENAHPASRVSRICWSWSGLAPRGRQCALFPSSMLRDGHVGRLTLAMVRVFATWKSANAVIQGFPLPHHHPKCLLLNIYSIPLNCMFSFSNLSLQLRSHSTVDLTSWMSNKLLIFSIFKMECSFLFLKHSSCCLHHFIKWLFSEQNLGITFDFSPFFTSHLSINL